MARCPAHDDKNPSLSVSQAHSGRILLYCHSGCDYRSIIDAIGAKATDLSGGGAVERFHKPIRPVRSDLNELMVRFCDSLPGSLGEVYLENRGIRLETAQRLGVGYAAIGEWPHEKDGRLVRQSELGRLVFPHTNTDGEIINLYGRSVELGAPVRKENRHDHLPGNKGIFNAHAIIESGRSYLPLYICEGPFDAVSLLEAGAHHAIAIFGVNGWRAEWINSLHCIVLAMDNDKAGVAATHKLERRAAPAADIVQKLGKAAYGDATDANESLLDGTLRL